MRAAGCPRVHRLTLRPGYRRKPYPLVKRDRHPIRDNISVENRHAHNDSAWISVLPVPSRELNSIRMTIRCQILHGPPEQLRSGHGKRRQALDCKWNRGFRRGRVRSHGVGRRKSDPPRLGRAIPRGWHAGFRSHAKFLRSDRENSRCLERSISAQRLGGVAARSAPVGGVLAGAELVGPPGTGPFLE